MINQCCYMITIDSQCSKLAEFEIRENTRTDPDNNTYSCQEHLPEMLGTTVGYPECRSWTVEFLYDQSDGHKSDCATHNMPAYLNGECNCQIRKKN